ncbi:unnamed protein product [Arctogadus glacialis]|uniref:segment polarity protein dishevelled homolog DVL-3 isoform X1 n=1 Tax=Gadus macrocephalus TaxID=80720 RepID=UPI0028CB463A|nr:segment polarity protein dishevelled homolog DVL-3 isoform X1 [Gadus macrocephalus]
MGDTRVIYHLDGQETPYLVRLSVPADRVTLGDFRSAINKPNYKFFFKSVDVDFGVVKEEITDDNAKLPCYNGRVISWLVAGDGVEPEDLTSEAPPTPPLAPPPLERTGGLGDSRPPSFHASAGNHEAGERGERPSGREDLEREGKRERRLEREKDQQRDGKRERLRPRDGRHLHPQLPEGAEPGDGDSSSSLLSSQLETTSFSGEEDSGDSRLSQSTEQSDSHRVRRHRRRRRMEEKPHMERSESQSSVTGSSLSLNILSVTLNTERYAFLGVSLVGQSSARGDGGVYIGSIMKGGAVAADGRIEPGDMLLQVNDITFENMTNDEAVRVLRDVVHKPGPITLTVVKCWDPQPENCFTLARSEPVRPIDPAAWVSHTAAMTGLLPPHYGQEEDHRLTIHSDMAIVAKAMANPQSGLEVRDRMWLKITIPNAFIGSEVVDWLQRRVEGFSDRREARRYAANLLASGHIRPTVSKISFSEQCYYAFNKTATGDMGLSPDGCAPLHQRGSLPGQYPVPHPYGSPPPPLHSPWGPPRSHKSGGSPSSGSERRQRQELAPSPLLSRQEAGDPPAEDGTPQPPSSPPSSLPGRGHDLSSELPASRQSFRLAIANPSDLLLDVM